MSYGIIFWGELYPFNGDLRDPEKSNTHHNQIE